MKFNKSKFDTTIAKCSEWSQERNIIKGSTVVDQAVMLVEELGELATSIRKDSKAAAVDAVGDMLVVLNGMCLQACRHDLRHLSDKIVDMYTQDITITKQDLLYLTKQTGIYTYGCDAGNKGMQVQRIENVLHGLNYIATKMGTTLDECLASAYEEIKDRKGVMYNGTFIKESDSEYMTICRRLAAKPALSANGNIIK